MEFQAVSGPKFTGHFSLNAGGIAIVCNVFRFWIFWAVPEIFAIKFWSCPKLTEIAPPPFFWGGKRPPSFWSVIIKFSQIPTTWQSFRAIGRGSLENEWRNKTRKKEDTSRVKHKPVRHGGSWRPNKDTAGYYIYDWYLLRAKFMNDWNFFVREAGLDLAGGRPGAKP